MLRQKWGLKEDRGEEKKGKGKNAECLRRRLYSRGESWGGFAKRIETSERNDGGKHTSPEGQLRFYRPQKGRPTMWIERERGKESR